MGRVGLASYAPVAMRPRLRLLAVIALLASLVVFGALADEMAEWGPFVSLDRHVDEELHEKATPWVTSLMSAVTWFGGTTGLTIVTVVVCAALLAGRHLWAAAFVALAFTGAAWLNSLLKVEFVRPRPSFAEPVVAPAGGYSFPSGHAMASMAVYGVLAYLAVVGVRHPALRGACVATAAALVAAIGFSRIYLGQHFPSDVIGGWAVGLAWICVLVLAGSLASGAAATLSPISRKLRAARSDR